MRQVLGGTARGAGSTALTLVFAVLVAAAVPLFWVWVASQIAGTDRDVTPSLAIFITTTILVSYWLILVIGGLVRGWLVDEEQERGRVRRMSWNRSFRDEVKPEDRQSDPVEVAFVVTAVLAIIAFEVWFFFFAGSPLPNQPLF